MSTTSITIEFDPNNLRGYTDEHLATLWHLAQANPADGFTSKEPGRLAMQIGWEIISRWLRAVPPEMYHHQDHHFWAHELRQLGRYQPGGPSGTPEWEQGHWAPRMVPDSPEVREALTAKLAELGVFGGKPGGPSLTREQIAQELTAIVMAPRDDDAREAGQ